MNRFVLSRAAGRDLDAVFRFVARDSIARAELLLGDIYEAIHLVWIVRVLHGARDLRTAFRESPLDSS